jgi:hypothetical protein
MLWYLQDPANLTVQAAATGGLPHPCNWAPSTGSLKYSVLFAAGMKDAANGILLDDHEKSGNKQDEPLTLWRGESMARTRTA